MSATARELAAGHPDAELPCPRCAAAVKGSNLDRHLSKVHPAHDGSDATAWTGPERLVLRPLIAIPLLVVAGVVTWSWRSGRELRPWFLVAAAVLLVFLVLSGLAVADTRVFVGRLSVDGDRVRLRHTLFLLTRTLRHVDRVEVGQAYRTVPSAGVSASTDLSSGGSDDVHAGVYLRIRDGRRALTVHCRTSTGVRRTWTGWRQGRRRRRWDITLAAGDFVALQYALVEAGVLQLRA